VGQTAAVEGTARCIIDHAEGIERSGKPMNKVGEAETFLHERIEERSKSCAEDDRTGAATGHRSPSFNLGKDRPGWCVLNPPAKGEPLLLSRPAPDCIMSETEI